MDRTPTSPFFKTVIPLVLFLTSFAFKAGGSPLSESLYVTLSKSFTKEIELSLKRFAQKPQSIIYGNEAYGYFASQDFNILRKKILLKMIPPGYKKEIEFYAQYRDKKNRLVVDFLGKKKFKNSLPAGLQTIRIEREGDPFHTPFVMVNGSLPRSQQLSQASGKLSPDVYKHRKHRYTFTMAINRLGEIVWAHVPFFDGALFSSYIAPKNIGKGYYGIMFGKQAGYFEIVRYDGKVVRKFSSRETSTPFTMHHDFEILSTNRVFALGNHMGHLSNFPGFKGKDKSFLSNNIIGIDLKSGKSKVLFDFLPSYNPNTTPYFTGDDPSDRKFVSWNSDKADFDFLHANAVEIVPDVGVLVSLRNINTLVMLDNRFKKIQWSMGPLKDATYRIENPTDQFQHSHTPSMISRDQVLVFDNGVHRKASRISIYRLKGRKAVREYSFTPSPSLYAPNRSSAYMLENGNILAFFVSPKQNGERVSRKPNQDILLEIDPKKNKLVSKTVLYFNTLSPGYRAIPLKEIGMEKFWGNKIKVSDNPRLVIRNRKKSK